jgi:hypothetical protein
LKLARYPSFETGITPIASQPNRLDHHPLAFLQADQGAQKKAELHGRSRNNSNTLASSPCAGFVMKPVDRNSFQLVIVGHDARSSMSLSVNAETN